MEQLTNIRRAIVDLTRRMLAVDPAKRPQSPAALKEELIKCIAAVETAKQARRRRFVYLAFAGITIALLALGLIYFRLRAPAPRPTADAGAYDRFVRAKTLMQRSSNGDARQNENFFLAQRLLEQATARDPSFFLAWAELAAVHSQIYYLAERSPARLTLAKQTLEKVHQLGPNRPEAHLANAYYFYYAQSDYKAARVELVIARRGLPNDPTVYKLLGLIDRREGHWFDHLKNIQRTVELNPRNVTMYQYLASPYEYLRHFPERAQALDRALAIAPTDPTTRVWRALTDLYEKADPQPAQDVIHDIITEDPEASATIASNWFYVSLCARNWIDAERAVAAMPLEGVGIPESVRIPRQYYEGLVALNRGDGEGANAAFTAAVPVLENTARQTPDYRQAHSYLGIVYAGLGRKDAAIREGRRAVELMPITKDAANGTELVWELAHIYTFVGEKDLALEELDRSVKLPGLLNYGELRLHPSWDSLRSDSRFEKIVAEAQQPLVIKNN